MVGRVDDFLVRGHQKVIGHYQLLLKSERLSAWERRLLESRLAKEEDELGRLVEAVEVRGG